MKTKNTLYFEELMEQFVDQAIRFRRIRPRLVANYQIHLIGSPVPFWHIGYVRYLKSIGAVTPTIDDLNDFRVGRYWEFLIQHHGAIQAERSMRALREFWRWAREMKHVTGRMPPDLRSALIGVEHPYRVKIALKQTENK